MTAFMIVLLIMVIAYVIWNIFMAHFMLTPVENKYVKIFHFLDLIGIALGSLVIGMLIADIFNIF